MKRFELKQIKHWLFNVLSFKLLLLLKVVLLLIVFELFILKWSYYLELFKDFDNFHRMI